MHSLEELESRVSCLEARLAFLDNPHMGLEDVMRNNNKTSLDVEITDPTKGLILTNATGTRLRTTEDTDANGNRLVGTTL